MSHFALPLFFILGTYVTMVTLNETIGLFRDRFVSGVAKAAGYIWLGAFMTLLCIMVVASSVAPARAKDLANVPFYSLFTLHIILMIFLFGWWLLVGRPPLREFLNIQRERPGEAVLIGLSVGLGGWIFTLAMSLAIAFILQATGILSKAPEPSPMIAWMATLPLWKKALIVLSAMTVEEFFFRAWLQKRIGLIASTILFAVAHAGLGQPFLLIGVGIISLVIGATFYRTKNLIPCIVAHGVFDAIQLFVVIPIAFRAMGLGS